MESTGKYWVPVFNLLEYSINVTVANPKWVKAVKGSKDDTKDSKWIGDLFRLGLVPGSFIPTKDVRAQCFLAVGALSQPSVAGRAAVSAPPKSRFLILREFTRYRFKLVSNKTGEKNRYQRPKDIGAHAFCARFAALFAAKIMKNVFTVCNIALDSVVSDMPAAGGQARFALRGRFNRAMRRRPALEFQPPQSRIIS
jgi:hypothetical protein